MSRYVNFDHANWAESDLGKPLNEFQKRVFNILGIIGDGIYNAPISWKSVDLNYGHNGVSVIWKYELATFDGEALTYLVFLCHEARIRCSIEGCGPRMMRMSFWQRTDSGARHKRHPDLEQAIANMREWLHHDNEIIHRNHKDKP